MIFVWGRRWREGKKKILQQTPSCSLKINTELTVLGWMLGGQPWHIMQQKTHLAETKISFSSAFFETVHQIDFQNYYF